MSRPKQFDPHVALGAAMEKFWERGFDATSLADITACTGVQKASLYATYGDKRHLFLTALSRYQGEGLAQLKAALTSGATARAAFEAVLDMVVKESASKHRARGCLCVNTAVELGPRDAEVGAMLLAHARRLTALFADRIERGQREGEVDPDLDPRAAAQFLLVTLFGITVGGKTGLGARKLHGVVRTALSILDR